MTDENNIQTIEPDLAEVITDAIRAALLDLHTGLPAKVIAFDPAHQSCNVQPLLKRAILTDEETVEIISLPIIHNVPVIYPAGGGWSMTWPLAVDDLVYLAFAERSLDAWLGTPAGTEVDPKDSRKHALSDAIAIPGLRPRVAPIPGISPTMLRISNDSGTVSLELSADAVNVTAPVVNIHTGGGTAVQHVPLGEALLAYIAGHTHPVATTGTAAAQTGTAGPPKIPPDSSLLSAGTQVSP